MNHEKDTWIEGVLLTADGIERAKAPADNYEKIRARITAASEIPTGYILRIAAAILLLVAINIFACISFSQTSRNHNLQAFSQEYGITGSGDPF